jgi:hypothetical protein
MRTAARAVILGTVLGLATVTTGLATESATVLRSGGFLLRTAAAYPSPIPVCSLDWQHEAVEGTEFHDLVVDDFALRELCAGAVLAHCGGDTLSVRGWWPEGDLSGLSMFRCVSLRGSLEVELAVTAPTAVTASRQWSGGVARAEHAVTLITPHGEVELLPEDGFPDQAQVILEPGGYGIRIDLDVRSYEGEFNAYDGSVTVIWADAATPTERSTWGAVKAISR